MLLPRSSPSSSIFYTLLVDHEIFYAYNHHHILQNFCSSCISNYFQFHHSPWILNHIEITSDKIFHRLAPFFPHRCSSYRRIPAKKVVPAKIKTIDQKPRHRRVTETWLSRVTEKSPSPDRFRLRSHPNRVHLTRSNVIQRNTDAPSFLHVPLSLVFEGTLARLSRREHPPSSLATSNSPAACLASETGFDTVERRLAAAYHARGAPCWS